MECKYPHGSSSPYSQYNSSRSSHRRYHHRFPHPSLLSISSPQPLRHTSVTRLQKQIPSILSYTSTTTDVRIPALSLAIMVLILEKRNTAGYAKPTLESNPCTASIAINAFPTLITIVPGSTPASDPLTTRPSFRRSSGRLCSLQCMLRL